MQAEHSRRWIASIQPRAASQRQGDTISLSCSHFALFMEIQPRSAANLSTGSTSHGCFNEQNHSNSALRNSQAASTSFGRIIMLHFNKATIACCNRSSHRLLCFACHHSQSGIVQDGLFLNRLHIPVNHLISSDITPDHHAQCLMAMARSELHGIV